jgi:hypothetical protein
MVRSLLVALLIPGAAACNAFKSVPPPPQEIIFHVASDPGRPLKDAALIYSGQKVAATGEDGVGKLKLTGKDGESFDITVSCPDGYQSPAKPTTVILRRLADTSKVPEYDVSCPPTARTVVVAVRADGGPNLPVMYLGREVARTDAAGGAHVLLKLKPDETFDLVLGTTADKANERLRPQNPFASFVVKDRDDVFTFDQKFEQEKKKQVVIGKRRGPVKIGP